MLLPVLLSLVAGISIFAIVYGLTDRAPIDPMEARLAKYDDYGDVRSLAQYEMSLPLADRVLRPFFGSLAEKLARRTPSQALLILQQKLNMAGRPYGLSVGGFLAFRLVAVVLFTLLGIAMVPLLGLSGAMAIGAPVVGLILGYLLPNNILSRRMRARKKEIRLALPSALDLLTIGVEAGLGFDSALKRVSEKYTNALSAEFVQVLNEIRLGRPRVDALDDMAKRNEVEELNNFIQAIIQSEQLGVGIANVLRIQSEEMRRRRRQRAEEMGQKAPLKMLFPMVGCIFPTLFIVLLGPAALSIMKQFGAH